MHGKITIISGLNRIGMLELDPSRRPVHYVVAR
jgi:hypothetical protein